MKPEKFFFPIMVFAAIIGIYLLFRKQEPATVQGPNTSASGLPTIAPQAQQYQVNPPTLTPSPLVMLADPYSNDPQAATPQRPPAYLAFNFGPSHDLTKTPFNPAGSGVTDDGTKTASGCGGCGSSSHCGCGTIDNVFPDGAACSKMSSNNRRQVATVTKDPWENALRNFNGADIGTPEPFRFITQPVAGPSDTTSTNNAPQSIPATVAKSVSNKRVQAKVPRIQAEYIGGGQNGQWGHEVIFTAPYGA